MWISTFRNPEIEAGCSSEALVPLKKTVQCQKNSEDHKLSAIYFKMSLQT
jgi:hypothetical protein